jgi:outer membrane protein TolC
MVLVRSRLAAATWLLAASALSAGNAQAAPLGLDDALRLAEQRSRLLVAQDAAAVASREMSIAAGQRPAPVLEAGINNLPIDGADRFSVTRDFMTMRSIGVMQEWTRADKLQARAARFEREAEAAQASRLVALADLRRDTATAWLELHFQQRMHDLLGAQRAEAALQVEAADAAYRGTRGSQADVFAARAVVAQIDDRIRQAEGDVATATTRLSRWVGDDAAQPLAPPPSMTSVALNPADLEAQVDHHPKLAVLERQEAMAQADADIARTAKRADWSVKLMLSQRGPAYSNMVSLGVSIPLQWDQQNRQDRDVAAKLAQVEQARAQRDEMAREHVAQVREWLQRWRSNRERLVQYDASLIPLAGERTRASIAAYRGAAGTLAAVLEARRMEIDVGIERLRLEMETAVLWAQLEYLIPAEHRTSLADRSALKEPQR